MLEAVLINFINLFVTVFNILLLARVLMSWIQPQPTSGIGQFIFDVTEPVLAPIRKLLPQTYMIDFSPIVAFLLLQLIASLVNGLFTG
ncbi:MAG TPA: YggT family protein [Candidatus Dormibacteraeota bacterium]|nr:YggT family protein [Candidatus Dormibacteraeota bacterium]